ncbi:MAG TPA: hypothetical protein VGG33_24405 [Polyangia bacterium]
MKKRSAEKVISRSILLLAVYRKNTMGRALRRRPSFWTVPKIFSPGAAPARKRLRLEFGETKGDTGFALTYADSRVLATHRPST